jgi:putative transposase
LRIYRWFVYGKGELNLNDPEMDEAFEIGAIENVRYRTRYFTDSGIIGTKEFVATNYQKFKHLFLSKHEKHPKTIRGMGGIYSLKRLSEKL